MIEMNSVTKPNSDREADEAAIPKKQNSGLAHSEMTAILNFFTVYIMYSTYKF